MDETYYVHNLATGHITGPVSYGYAYQLAERNRKLRMRTVVTTTPPAPARQAA